MSKLEDDNQENIVRWVVRYVMIPVSLAVITGLFALEVINREIKSRETSVVDVVDAAFATMTAVATFNPLNPPTPVVEPSRTPTAVPAATEEANIPATEESVADNPPATTVVLPPTAVCGIVPAGWQRYVVQPGNTFYSLAQQTGTTVAKIRQVNCLGETLPLVSIWLPFTPGVEIESTAVILPTAVTESTITVTVPGLPDLIGYTSFKENLSVACVSGPGTCVTSITLAVSNVGAADADVFNIQVWLDPAQSVVLNQTVEHLMPGETVSFSLASPPGGNCYDPNCTVCILIDTRGAIAEENEENNQVCTTFNG